MLKPAPFCKLFAGLGSTNKSTTFLPFSCYLTLVLSSQLCSLLHLSFYFRLSGRSGRSCSLSPLVLSVYNRTLDTRFSRGTTWLTSWPDREHYSCPLQSLVVSILFLLSTLLFSRTGGVLFHLNSLTQRFPRFLLKNLCSLVTFAVFSLVFAATDTVDRKILILLRLAELRILLAAPADTCSKTPLISFCIVQLRTLRRSILGNSLSLYDLWSRPWGVARLLGLYGFPLCPHPSERVG